MKTSLNLFMFLTVLCAFIEKSHAQSSASANIYATIVHPITIAKVSGKDMHFGNIASGNSSGIVVLNTSGVRSAQGGVVLPSSTGSVSTAEFVVTGEGSLSYSITLPSSAVTLVNANNETMVVDSFTSTPQTGTLSAGSQVVKVGASLKVNAQQAPGEYTTLTPFNVTVNYN